MSTLRAFAAAAVASLSLVALERTASAEVLDGFKLQEKSFSQNIAKGDFGAGFEMYGRTTQKDYAKMCVSADPVTRCASIGNSLGKRLCSLVWTQQKDFYCAQGSNVGYAADGKAGADVTLFGKDFALFDINGGAYVEPYGSGAYYGIYVLNKKIKGATATEFSVDIPLAERTLVSAESTFNLGPVPITVGVDATGSLGIELAMSAGTATVGGRARPHVGVDAVFSAGVGVRGASVGIYGDLLLAEVSVPATAKVTNLGNKRFGYEAGLDVEVHTLDGAVGLYGEFATWRKEWEIFSWTGLEYSWKLGSKTGTIQL